MPFRITTKKRFAIYSKTENGWFSEKKNLKASFWKAWFVNARADDNKHQLVYSTDDATESKWLFLTVHLICDSKSNRLE